MIICIESALLNIRKEWMIVLNADLLALLFVLMNWSSKRVLYYPMSEREEEWFYIMCLLYWPSTWFSHLTEYFKVVISVGLIVLGAFVAGSRDLSFDAYGYGVVFLSNITTAVYLATIARIGNAFNILSLEKSSGFHFAGWQVSKILTGSFFLSGKSSGLNSFGLMWCNGTLKHPDSTCALSGFFNLWKNRYFHLIESSCDIMVLFLYDRIHMRTDFAVFDFY